MFENGVILAAGRGTRMLPLSEHAPKPLLPVVEDCLLKQQVAFMRARVRNLHVTVGYMAPKVSQVALELGVDSVVDIGQGGNASWLTSSPLGEIDSPTLIITCDNIMTVPIESLDVEAHQGLGRSMIVAIEREANFPGDRLNTTDSKIVSMGASVDSKLLASGLQVLVPQRVTKKN